MLLEARLAALQKEFRGAVFFEILEEAKARLHKVARRDARHIRDDVFHAIDMQGCRNLEEIIEETQLTRKVVQGVLDELVLHDLIAMAEEPAVRRDPNGGAPRMEYYPIHTQPHA